MNPLAPVPLPGVASARREVRPSPERRSQANPMEAIDYLPEWFGDGDQDRLSRHRDDRGDWGNRRDRDGRDRPQKRRGLLSELLEGFGE
jgi:hypothetical protein